MRWTLTTVLDFFTRRPTLRNLLLVVGLVFFLTTLGVDSQGGAPETVLEAGGGAAAVNRARRIKARESLWAGLPFFIRGVFVVAQRYHLVHFLAPLLLGQYLVREVNVLTSTDLLVWAVFCLFLVRLFQLLWESLRRIDFSIRSDKLHRWAYGAPLFTSEWGFAEVGCWGVFFVVACLYAAKFGILGTRRYSYRKSRLREVYDLFLTLCPANNLLVFFFVGLVCPFFDRVSYGESFTCLSIAYLLGLLLIFPSYTDLLRDHWEEDFQKDRAARTRRGRPGGPPRWAYGVPLFTPEWGLPEFTCWGVVFVLLCFYMAKFGVSGTRRYSYRNSRFREVYDFFLTVCSPNLLLNLFIVVAVLPVPDGEAYGRCFLFGLVGNLAVFFLLGRAYTRIIRLHWEEDAQRDREAKIREGQAPRGVPPGA